MLPAGFSAAASGCEFLGRAIGRRPGQDELVHARGRPQIDEPSQDVDEICLRIDPGQLAGLDELNDVGIELDPRCGHIKDLGKLDGSPTPVPRTTSSRGGGWLPRALGSPAADPCHCTTNVCGWQEGL